MNTYQPLSERLRPKVFDTFYSTAELKASLKPFLSGQYISSLLFWGPPGCGKTTAARLIGNIFSNRYTFVELSAVASGVKEIKELAAKAQEHPIILFLDEIHRFSKTQQDSLLPYVENGSLILIGATTENPSFSVIAPLMSRSRLIIFPALDDRALEQILTSIEGELNLQLTLDVRQKLLASALGDARKLCTMVDHLYRSNQLTAEGILAYGNGVNSYDTTGDQHYDLASAMIKSIRGSDPDAGLFYALKMCEAGEDPRFIFRRLIILASEDIGNADPNALRVAVSGAEAFDRIGLPEGRIILSQVITYLAVAPKSNRSYAAMHKALDAIKKYPQAMPPLHLRNASTGLRKSMGHGKEYAYVHDLPGAYAKGVRYLPDEIKAAPFYEPSDQGIEQKIKERLRILRGQ